MNISKCLFIFFILSFYKLNAQERFNYEGKIINSETGKGIMWVHVWNESLKLMSITDSTGYFRIFTRPSDTLVISSVGYFGKHFTVNKEVDVLNIIKLDARTYEIPEAEIVNLGKYSDFKQKFLNLKLEPTQIEILRNSLDEISKEIALEANYNLAMKKAAEGGSLASASILTPEERQYIKLKQIKKDEEVQKIIDKKYNRQIVADLTGLKDKELDEFILFCHFDRNYLINTNQYDILVKVLEKYEEFKLLKKTGMLEENYLFCELRKTLQVNG